MENLAAAIIGALVSGAANVAKEAVGDAYVAAKQLLKEFVPRFDSESLNPDEEASTIEELAQRLQGLTEAEQAELAGQMAPLAEVMGTKEQAQALQYVVKNVRVGKNAELELGKGDHNIEGVDVGENLRIKTGQ